MRAMTTAAGIAQRQVQTVLEGLVTAASAL